jgi:hypothetical protein
MDKVDLFMNPWKPSFNPLPEPLTYDLIWVIELNLPFEYWNIN